jgi:hypothetical protein
MRNGVMPPANRTSANDIGPALKGMGVVAKLVPNSPKLYRLTMIGSTSSPMTLHVWGFEVAAEIVRAQLPQTKKGRSGDLGEILATELVEK